MTNGGVVMEGKNYPNPGVAAVLSFLFTGLGQIYNGQITKGLILMTLSAAIVLLLIVGSAVVAYSILGVIGGNGFITGLVFIISSILVLAMVGVYNIYDAYNTAKKNL